MTKEELARIPKEHRNGNCYEAAACFMIAREMLEKPSDRKLVLVHGEVCGQGPLEGLIFGHAWVENGETVIDMANGKHLRMHVRAYYALGKIKQTVRYSFEEMRRNILYFKHYGPWDQETPATR